MLILKLLVAHFLGDFVFQFNKWVKDKEKNKLKSKYLYIHTAIHFLLLLIMVGFQSKYLILVLFIGLSHLMIDGIKLLRPIKNKRLLFFIDQLAHLLVIGGAVVFFQSIQLHPIEWITEKTMLLLLSFLLVTSVTSVVLKVLFTKWNNAIDKISEDHSSLKDAGKYIGMLERVLVFTFVILNKWEAVGFLLAAKSVFRFGDLTKAKDRLLTEYILIGTLLSFGIAIITGIVYLKIVLNLL